MTSNLKKAQPTLLWKFLGTGVIVIALLGLFFVTRDNFRENLTPTPISDKIFANADNAIKALARRIEQQENITLSQVKNLPENALNARYGDEKTLLFHAVNTRNLKAMGVLIRAGADTHMVDHPSKGSKEDFLSAVAMLPL